MESGLRGQVPNKPLQATVEYRAVSQQAQLDLWPRLTLQIMAVGMDGGQLLKTPVVPVPQEELLLSFSGES